MKKIKDSENPEFDFSKARRVTPEETEIFRKAIENTLGVKRPRRGRPLKARHHKYRDIHIKLHPKAVEWAKTEAKRRGYNVPEEKGYYYVEVRNVVFWSFGDHDLAIGEDAYSSMNPDAFEKVPDDELPQVYRDYLIEIGKLDPALA